MASLQQQQTVAVQVQQPMVTVQPEPSVSNGTRSRNNWKGLRITGYLQVILGVISVLFGFLSIVFRTHLYFIGYAIWMGVCFYIITGILGIASGGKQKKSVVSGYLIMSIHAAVCACGMIILSGINIYNDIHICPSSENYQLRQRVGCAFPQESRLAIDALVMVIGVAELVVAIIGGSLTCCTLCCQPSQSHPMVYYQSAPQIVAPSQPTVQYFVPQQQFQQQPQYGNVMYTGQPVIVAPAQPLQPPPGQVYHQAPPQGTAPPQGAAQPQGAAPPQAQAQAQEPGYETPEPASKSSNLPEDHHSKPLIT